jgi:hypothetical protein
MSQCAYRTRYLNESSGRISVGAQDYSNSIQCTWIISPINSSQVVIKFTALELEGPASCCVGDYVEIFECADLECILSVKKLVRLSGTMAVVPPTIVSKTGIMRMDFKTDISWAMSGFEASYFSPCPAGTYGRGMPDCLKCKTSCSGDKSLVLTSCGAVGSTVDNECVCRPGQHSTDNSDRCSACPVECDVGERWLCFSRTYS